MEKLALIELGMSRVKLTIYDIRDGEHFTKCDQYVEPLSVDDEIRDDELIKGIKIREIVALLGMFKKICESEGVNRYLAVCTSCITNAKNYQTFVDECSNAIGHEVKIMTAEQEIGALYTATINSLDAPRGIIINISSNSTRIIHYNRRIVIESATLPVGTNNYDPAKINLREMLTAKAPFLSTLDEESLIVCTGEVFSAFGRLHRKTSKYPLDVEHNFPFDQAGITKSLTFLQGLDSEKQQRLKGISDLGVPSLLSGLTIAKEILELANTMNMVLSSHDRSTGLMFHYTIPMTIDRGITDMLGYSLGAIVSATDLKRKRCDQMYDLSLNLFKQLKVMHKLPRNYARILRAASYMYHIGKKIGAENWSKQNYHIILNLPILGMSHKDIVLTAFAASCRKWEDFNLSEWVKFKDIVNEEDLEALKKLSNILAIAEALNIRGQEIVKDITCDILGDSVILKLVTDLDTKAKKIDPNLAAIEIYYARKYKNEFAKVFKKNMEIL